MPMELHATATGARRRWLEANPLYRWINKGNLPAERRWLIAEDLGVTQQTVYNWLTGFALPETRLFIKLWRLTGITLETWVQWLESKEAPP